MKTVGPEDIFHYVYAILHSAAYRKRYADFLKDDFPRIPLTSLPQLFSCLALFGEHLVRAHTLSFRDTKYIKYPVAGNHLVGEIRYTFPIMKRTKGKLWINEKQYFEGVPRSVWDFHIGGNRVCELWLRYRKDRVLTYEERMTFAKIIVAIMRTVSLMIRIDKLIDKLGGWPVQ